MIDVLSGEGLAALARLVAAGPLLAFDFDGTLAPIATDRRGVRLAPATRARLRELSRAFPVAVISGRARADLAARLSGLPDVALVGNHGGEAEGAPQEPRLLRRVAAWASTLADRFGDVEGVEVEDKRLTVAVHYRRARRPDEARRRILASAVALPGARVTGGKAVVNVIPVELPTKGAAVERLARAHGRSRALFVGDDLTDEDAFTSPVVAVAVRIGRDPGSAARYHLESQDRVDTLLDVLLAGAPARRGS